MPYRILILGASYGSLLAMKLLLAGQRVQQVCLPDEEALINAEGLRVRIPLRGQTELIELDSRLFPGMLSASGPLQVKLEGIDLAILAMQEPQYRSPGVRELLAALAAARLPCMSIMNMPPLPYLYRLPGVSAADCRHCYADASVWDGFDPDLMTLCSPDPQAFRPPEEKTNVLQVRLPSNFKAARFVSEAHTAMLRELEAGIDALRWPTPAGPVEVPVKLRLHDSVFVPLAKWSMLMAGNYRCIQKDSMRAIQQAVHSDLEDSRAVYNWVADLCRKLGASDLDLVPFEKYAAAAQGLGGPSSAARALFGGAQNIERADRLVQTIALQHGMRNKAVDEVVALVDARLLLNRSAALTP